jgi:hypothetical protein
MISINETMETAAICLLKFRIYSKMAEFGYVISIRYKVHLAINNYFWTQKIHSLSKNVSIVNCGKLLSVKQCFYLVIFKTKGVNQNMT